MDSPAPSMLTNRRPRIAVTMGDPAGIGPEVVLKALGKLLRPGSVDAEIVVVGPRSRLLQDYQVLSQRIERDGQDTMAHPAELNSLDVPLDGTQAAQITWGRGNGASGDVSFRALKMAIERAVAGEFDAIVTAPIAKSAWKAAGHVYPGQTELLAEGAGVDRFGMLFVARSPHIDPDSTDWTLKTLLATTHIPLRAVPDALTPGLMSTKLSLLIECLKADFGLTQPRIAISGLNPHSGEEGQLGHEELDWLTPWIATQREMYPNAVLDGPVPPDTLWVEPGQAWYGRRAWVEPEQTRYNHQVHAHDAYLALYHDQGLIPLKLLAFDRAVNTTIGLPFVRTSPDHGTAFAIAGKGIANPTSMVAALEFALELVHQRRARAVMN
ncbi:MAG: 4-hydroxythreonine-4-phosphate dehydrogenase PdxA [Cyanobacteria bacterium P01_D01_bin.128]